MTTTTATVVKDGDRAFLGHPKALGFLSFSEAWERFSYYGMQSLLVLYMTKTLLLSPHVEQIAGFEGFRAFIGQLYGLSPDASTQVVASTIFGLYTSLVYLTPIFGGLLADQLLGRTRTIVIGALLMAAGHFLMAFDVSFLLALLCLVLGTGCFKGNIAGQVGSLYAEGDLRRADAFQIFYLGINAGVIAAPLIAGTLGETVGWHYGFGAAGVGMLIALVIYLAGRRHLPPDPRLRRKGPAVARPKMRAHEWRTVGLLILLLPVLTASVLCNQQIFNAYLVWADTGVDLTFFGSKVPTTWLITLDSVVSVSFLAIMVVFWRVWATRFKEPDEIGKLTIGAFISVLGVLCLAAGAAQAAAAGTQVSIWWCVAFHVLNSIAFANMLPVSLALYARAAPAAITGFVIGLYYLHLVAGNQTVGILGTLLEKMPPTQFWLMHAGIAAGAAVVFLVVGRFFATLLSHENVKGPAAPAHA
ncbi:peptide MFS transporter [Phenylobacterium sp. J367]|uniref:peptide MFS transporter n=1 Tax=Phenylobacterium sp. J367 TaxID=2898435 RepID=UPI002151A9D1|nr:peptide MFS transporter [Phenylobacterium sp. J367]MCR5880507.1 peptide MFS transporter [Phenylobacterium sp. J367]